MNTKPRAVADAAGRPIRFCMTAGQISDDTGAAALLGGLPKAEWLLAGRGDDAEWFRDALKDKGTRPCIPARKSHSKPIKPDKRRYRIKMTFASRVNRPIAAKTVPRLFSDPPHMLRPASSDA